MNEKENLIKGGYLVELVGHDGKKFLWGVQDYHVVEEPTHHCEIGISRFDFNLFDEENT